MLSGREGIPGFAEAARLNGSDEAALEAGFTAIYRHAMAESRQPGFPDWPQRELMLRREFELTEEQSRAIVSGLMKVME